jgi:hypothetical protein
MAGLNDSVNEINRQFSAVLKETLHGLRQEIRAMWIGSVIGHNLM